MRTVVAPVLRTLLATFQSRAALHLEIFSPSANNSQCFDIPDHLRWQGSFTEATVAAERLPRRAVVRHCSA